MKIAICDDEKEIRDSIERNIRLAYSDFEIIQFEDGNALLECAAAQTDILFLDAQMSRIDGIEVARELRRLKNNVTIIFVTATEEYVFQAFDVNAFNYLIKPIDNAKFFDVLHRAVEDRERINAEEAKAKEEASVSIKKGKVIYKVFLNEIVYLEVFNRTVILHTADKDIEFYGKLKEWENSLGDDFMRCHRAFIVNMHHVLKYNANRITLDNGVSVSLSKQKYTDFVKKYRQYY